MSLFDISDLSAEQIVGYLDRAESYRGKRTAELTNMTVATLFLEPSTRTRLSFELAATRLGAEVISFSPEHSSGSKGESFQDTVATVAAMGAQILIVRHSLVGSPQVAARWTGLPVINGGDGRKAHPTQTLLDLLTIRRHFGRINGLDIAVVGDVENSRVARGLLNVLPRLGSRVTMVGPSSFVADANPWSSGVTHDLDAVLPEVDVVYLLRVQKERGAGVGYPGDSAYHRRFGMDRDRAEQLRPGAVIMHPGPINRGVEIASQVADSDQCLILEQVANGLPIRMAALAIEAGDLA